jgi:hypothetical protein
MKIIIENMKTKWQWLRSVDARGYKRGQWFATFHNYTKV